MNIIPASFPAEFKDPVKMPVTKRAIELQAGLFRAMREGKNWAQNQSVLHREVGCANKVYKLLQESGKETAAFFKTMVREDKSAGQMEKLVWDIAVLLGFEDHFVPTGVTQLRTQSELQGGQEKVSKWEGGNLAMLDYAKAGLLGSIQPAQKGTTLDKLTEVHLSRHKVAEGMLLSVIFGMFDLHKGNLIITPENQILFFDNTRCLPNSNGFIKDNYDVISAYRCALLDLPEANEPLLQEEIEDLQGKTAQAKQKMALLWAFLNAPQTKATLQKLPPVWIDLPAAFEAMKERVDNLDMALKKGAIKTAADLALQCVPYYKFICATVALCSETLTDLHESLGYDELNTQWKNLSNSGYDLKKIKEFAEDPSRSFSEMIRTMNEGDVQPFKSAAGSKEFVAELIRHAALDFKDIERARCMEIIREIRLKAIPLVAKPFDLAVKDLDNATS